MINWGFLTPLFHRFFGIAMVATALIGCSSSPKINTNSAEGAYAQAEKYEKDERYEEAIAQYNTVKNKFPYSSLATESELKVADIHFKREDFPEAQGAYQTFKELHPAHAKADYVTFRLGLSLMNQLPSTIDRDLSLADKALLYFEEVSTSFSKSGYVDEANVNRRKILRMLADKEMYVAQFYFKHDQFDSALGRFEDLITKFPESGLEAQALLGAFRCARRLSDASKSQDYFDRLQSKFGATDEAKRAKEERRDAK